MNQTKKPIPSVPCEKSSHWKQNVPTLLTFDISSLFVRPKVDRLNSKMTMSSPSEQKHKVGWTVADLFPGQRPFLAYHVAGAGYDVLTPVGVAVGSVLHVTKIYQPYTNILQTAGTAGLIGGATGILLGTTRLAITAAKGKSASPPWDEEGIQKRVDGLHDNFKVRVMDKSVWMGMGAAAVAMYVAGGPQKCGLSSGYVGIAQGLSLGSAVGSVSAAACWTCVKKAT